MSQIIVLDSTPLGLLLQKSGLPAAEECRLWIIRKRSQGARFVVPEIIEYEVRRELLRINRQQALKGLEIFLQIPPTELLSLNPAALKLVAAFWAKARQQGTPTAHPHTLDVDVILCAQVLRRIRHAECCRSHVELKTSVPIRRCPGVEYDLNHAA